MMASMDLTEASSCGMCSLELSSVFLINLVLYCISPIVCDAVDSSHWHCNNSVSVPQEVDSLFGFVTSPLRHQPSLKKVKDRASNVSKSVVYREDSCGHHPRRISFVLS